MSSKGLHMHPGDPGMGRQTHGSRTGLGGAHASREGDGADQPGQENGIRDEKAIRRGSGEGVNPQNTGSMPRADEHPAGLEDSQEFRDRPGGTNQTP